MSDHFARPGAFAPNETDTCVICNERIALYPNPDGRRIWHHITDVQAELGETNDADLR